MQMSFTSSRISGSSKRSKTGLASSWSISGEKFSSSAAEATARASLPEGQAQDQRGRSDARGIHEFVCEIVGDEDSGFSRAPIVRRVAQLPRICIREGADDIEPGSGLPVASPCEPASRRRALNVACRARSSGLPSHCSRYRGVDPAAALSRGGGRYQHAPGPRPSSSSPCAATTSNSGMSGANSPAASVARSASMKWTFAIPASAASAGRRRRGPG